MSKQGSFDRFFQVLILAGLGAFELYFYSFLLKANEIDWFLVILFGLLAFMTSIFGLIGITFEIIASLEEENKSKKKMKK